MAKYDDAKKNAVAAFVSMVKEKGLFYIFKKIFYKYTYRIFLPLVRGKSFLFRDKKYKYFLHPYNITWSNERAVEVPIALDFLAGFSEDDVLEIGNVLSHYMDTRWDVVDKYEDSPAENVNNVDILEYTPDKKYRRIISLSTFEHIGFDEEPKDTEKVIRAIEHVRNSCLAHDGQALISIPINWNPDFDERLKRGDVPFSEVHYFKRTGWMNTWRYAQKDETMNTRFAKPFLGANGLIIGILRK